MRYFQPFALAAIGISDFEVRDIFGSNLGNSPSSALTLIRQIIIQRFFRQCYYYLMMALSSRHLSKPINI